MGRRKRERRRKYLEVCATAGALKKERERLMRYSETAYYRGILAGRQDAKEELTRSIGPKVDGNDEMSVVYVNGKPQRPLVEATAWPMIDYFGVSDNFHELACRTVLFETKWMALDAYGTRFLWHVLVPRGFDGYWSDAK